MTLSTRSPSAMAMSLGSSAPLAGKQPVAALILLADDRRLHGGAVKVFADLHLDQRALLLDHDDHFEAAREIPDVLDVERPRTADLEQAHPDLVRPGFVDADFLERLADVEIALADGDDADLGVAAARIDHPVEAVGADEGRCGGALVFVQPRLLAERSRSRGGC